jgi:putative PD-(D/E)XK family protein DUF4420
LKQADLEAIWEGLGSPLVRNDLVGQPIDAFGCGVKATLAIDGEGRRHLLIPAAADAEDPSQPSIRGIGLSVDDLRVDDLPVSRYYDISCRDMTMHENFSVVVAEILEALPSMGADVGPTLNSIFNRWRWFWRVAPNSMSLDVAIGLFGELWFIEHWLAPVDAAVLAAWTGPQGDRHDFKWPYASVEVKATRVSSDGSAKHRISRLDQLEDPEKGTLHLFSLRVAIDEIGGNSLNQSIRRLRDQLTETPDLLANFEEAIGLLGYNPGHSHHYDVPLRVIGEELYRIEEGFPRLTGDTIGTLPPGVDDISYSLNLTACRDWLVATKPGRESRELRSSLTF